MNYPKTQENHISPPLEDIHRAEFQLTKPVRYIPLASKAIREIIGDIDRRSDAVEQAQATIDAVAMINRIDQLKIDAMTGLPTRTVFDEVFQRFIDRAEFNSRKAEQVATVLILGDLNNLKVANDIDKSHKMGDAYIKLASEGFKDSSRIGDFNARVGGDEFASVILVKPDVSEDGTLDYVAPTERIVIQRRFATNTNIDKEGFPFEVEAGITLGYAIYQPGDTPDTMYIRADKMVYDAKPSKPNAN